MSAQNAGVYSMTGFARQEGGDDVMNWAWELKSVNGKSLDVRARLFAGFESLEGVVRSRVQEKCARGNVQANLTVDRSAMTPEVQVNRAVLDRLLAISEELKSETALTAPSIDGILSLKGVLETVEVEEDPEVLAARLAAVEQDLLSALDALRVMRREEGKRLAALAGARLDEIDKLTCDAAALAATQPAALRERLKNQIEELLQASPALSEERLSQEAAILAGKSDVREELDRLVAHVEAARGLLAQGGPIGRKLDFLCQEFNREANTLCSKASDVALTRIGLDLKSAIEQLREQIQNIE